MNNFYLVLSLISIIAIFFVVLAVGKYQQPKFVPVKIGNATVNAEVADTEPKQIRGLMFRESLPKDGGMLFAFSREGRHGIWMMNTSIPLDLIWLDGSKKVVHIEKNVQPCEALLVCPVYTPDSNAKYVLEVKSGYSGRHGIKIGAVAKFAL